MALARRRHFLAVTESNTTLLAQRFLHHDDAKPPLKFVADFAHSTGLFEPKFSMQCNRSFRPVI
jgi:hypothetical protein